MSAQPAPAIDLIPEPALPATATAREALEALARWADEWVEAVEDLAADDIHYEGKIEGFRAVSQQARFWAQQLPSTSPPPPSPARVIGIGPPLVTPSRAGPFFYGNVATKEDRMSFSVSGSRAELIFPFLTEDGPTRADLQAIADAGLKGVTIARHAWPLPLVVMEWQDGSAASIAAAGKEEPSTGDVEALQLRVAYAVPALLGHAEEQLSAERIEAMDAEEGTAEDLAQALRETVVSPLTLTGDKVSDLNGGLLMLRAFDTNSRRVLAKLAAFAEAWGVKR